MIDKENATNDENKTPNCFPFILFPMIPAKYIVHPTAICGKRSRCSWP